MRRPLAAALVALAFAAGCASSPENREAAIQTAAAKARATTSTEAPPTTTSTLAPTTTTSTTAPPPPPPPQPVELASSGARAAISPNGVVVPIVGAQGADALVSTPCGVTVPLRSGFPLADVAVVLDPGHGGVEPGAVGPGGLSEKVLNLAVTKYAEEALERAGFSTVLTRSDDYRVTIKSRADIVKALQPKAFVSVHFNAEPDGPFPRPGAETYYQVASADSKRLSGLIYEEIVKAMSQYNLAWVADTDAGAKYRRSSTGGDYYGVLRQTNGTPGVLAEVGFISNAPEEAIYITADVQKVAGEALARGVVRYLTTAEPGSGFTEPYPRESPAGGGGGKSNCADPAL